MRVLVTGATGYLGNAIIKSNVFDEPVALSRKNSLINCDLANEVPVLTHFDMVIHTAGKAHVVPRTPLEHAEFFKVNVTGTNHLLQGLEQGGIPHTFVFISTVAVYGLPKGKDIAETAALLATDAYGKSKIEAEQLVSGWCQQHGVHCVILRLPLIAGPNPPGNLGAMIRAIRKGYYLNIGGGQTRRSVVLLDDVVQLLPALYGKNGICNLTDNADFSYAELGRLIALQLQCRPPGNLPMWMATIIARIGNMLGAKAPFNQNKLDKMTASLTFSTQKAKEIFGWKPRKVLSVLSIK